MTESGSFYSNHTLAILALLVLEHPRLGRVVRAIVTESRRKVLLVFVVHHARLVRLLDALERRKLLPLGERLGLGNLGRSDGGRGRGRIMNRTKRELTRHSSSEGAN